MPARLGVCCEHGRGGGRGAVPRRLLLRERDDARWRNAAASAVPRGLVLGGQRSRVLGMSSGALGWHVWPYVGCVLRALRRRPRGRVSVAGYVCVLICVPCRIFLP